MEKLVIQIMSADHWQQVLQMMDHNVEGGVLKVVAMSKAIFPVFLPCEIRRQLAKRLNAHIELDICAVSMLHAGIDAQDVDMMEGMHIVPGGMRTVLEARRNGFEYVVLA